MGERGWRGEVWLACGRARRFLPFPRHTASRATRAIRSIQAKALRRRQTRTSCASLESGEDEVVAAVGRGWASRGVVCSVVWGRRDGTGKERVGSGGKVPRTNEANKQNTRVVFYTGCATVAGGHEGERRRPSSPPRTRLSLLSLLATQQGRARPHQANLHHESSIQGNW